jgi:hypothetical protein
VLLYGVLQQAFQLGGGEGLHRNGLLCGFETIVYRPDSPNRRAENGPSVIAWL